MSDPMEDEEFVYAATDAMRFAARKVRPATVSGMTIDAQWRNECCREIAMLPAVLRALNDAGYRIVKPDGWTLCADGRFVNKTDNRAEAIQFILEAGEDAEFGEVLEVPRTRSDLLAELDSMKEAGE